MGSSGGGVDRAHETANMAHASIIDDRTDDRIIPTRNEYRRSEAAASVYRNGDRFDARIARPLR
jgi:hypothetical protein